MIDSNGIVKLPINPQELYYLMGVAPKGRYSINYICSNKHGKINPYSYHKPVRSKKLFFSNEFDFEGDYNGKPDNYGLRISGYATYGVGGDVDKILDDLIKPLPSVAPVGEVEIVNRMVWTYLPPEGVIGISPYRINDLDGYNHNAPMPVTRSQGEYLVNLSKTNRLEVKFSLSPDNELPMEMMQPTFDKEIPGVVAAGLFSYYVSAAIYKVSSISANGIPEYTRVLGAYKSEGSIQNGATVVFDDLKKLPVGEYWIGALLDSGLIEGIKPGSPANKPEAVYGRFFAPLPATYDYPNPFKLTIEQTIIWKFEILYWSAFSPMSASLGANNVSETAYVYVKSDDEFGFYMYTRITNYASETARFNTREFTAKITGGKSYWPDGSVYTLNTFVATDPSKWDSIETNDTCEITGNNVSINPNGYCFLKMKFSSRIPSGLFAEETLHMTVSVMREGAVMATSPELKLSISSPRA